MELTIKIKIDNAAFDRNPELEVKRILNDLAKKLDGSDFSMVSGGKLMDVNGNSVGRWSVE